MDGQKPDVIARALQAESESHTQRERHGSAVWSYLGEVSPAMGMIGTLVGLVALLDNKEDPQGLTTNMATALRQRYTGLCWRTASYFQLQIKYEFRVKLRN